MGVSEIKTSVDEELLFDNLKIEKGDFSGRKVRALVSIGSHFQGCRFEKMKIKQACFGAGTSDSTYVECVFDGSKITSVAPGYARFERCSFRDVTLKNFFCMTVEFVECVFSGKIEKAFFNGTVPKSDVPVIGRAKNDFYGNDFSMADLVDVGFRSGIDLRRQKMPTDSRYLFLTDAEPVISRAINVVKQWKESTVKVNSISILKALMLELEDGQQQIFLQSDSFSPRQKEAAIVVVDLLRSLTN